MNGRRLIYTVFLAGLLALALSDEYSISVSISTISSTTATFLIVASTDSTFSYLLRKNGEDSPSLEDIRTSGTSFPLRAGENNLTISSLQAHTSYVLYYSYEGQDHSTLKNQVRFVTNAETTFSVSIKESSDTDILSFPFVITNVFTKPVRQFTEENILLSNGLLQSIQTISSKEFKVFLLPTAVGTLSYTYQNLVSEEGETIDSPPFYKWYYKGVSILNIRGKSCSDGVDIELRSSGQGTFYCLNRKQNDSSVVPSIKEVLEEGIKGQDHSSSSSMDFLYLFSFSSLEEGTTYKVYCTGKDLYDLPTVSSIEESSYQYTTTLLDSPPPEDQSESSSTCGTGWKGLVCSGQGQCKNNQCECDPPFTGPLCTLLQCSLIIRPNSTHTLIHLSMDMIIDYNDHYDYDTNDKDYETISRLQKEEREYQQAWFKISLSETIQFPVHQICIRVWNVHKQLIGSTYTSKEDHEDISVPSVNMRGRQLQESSNIYLNTLNLFMTLLVKKTESQAVLQRLTQYYQSPSTFLSLEPYGLVIKENNITKALVQVYEDPYTCYNNVIDDKETDIDCGGICTSTCLYGQSCLVDGDCATNHCRNHICEDGTILDTISNNKIYLILSIIGVILIIFVILFFVLMAVKKCRNNRRVASNAPTAVDTSVSVMSGPPVISTVHSSPSPSFKHGDPHKHRPHPSRPHHHSHKPY